jgi:hypothetical protein
LVAAHEAAAKCVRGNSGPSQDNEHRGNLPVTCLGADRTACDEEPESYPAHGRRVRGFADDMGYDPVKFLPLRVLWGTYECDILPGI